MPQKKEKEKEKEMVYLEVTVKKYYAFEEGRINGWSADQVVDDWFGTYDINSSHASRDSYHLGNADIVAAPVHIVSLEELDAGVKRYQRELKTNRARIEMMQRAQRQALGRIKRRVNYQCDHAGQGQTAESC